MLPNYDIYEPQDDNAIPLDLVGRDVTVCISEKPLSRSDFHLQISVEGELEKRTGLQEYRVVMSDGTFAYFGAKDVGAVLIGRGERRHTDAVIYLVFSTTREDILKKLKEIRS
jgi:hypothetical protein